MRAVQAPREQLPPLDLRRLRDLDLNEPPRKGHSAHIASASGIAKRGDFVYVVGDDLLEVGVIGLAGGGPGTARRVFAATADAEPQWHLVMAAVVLAMLPPVLVVIFMQRLFVKGLVETEK